MQVQREKNHFHESPRRRAPSKNASPVFAKKKSLRTLIRFELKPPCRPKFQCCLHASEPVVHKGTFISQPPCTPCRPRWGNLEIGGEAVHETTVLPEGLFFRRHRYGYHSLHSCFSHLNFGSEPILYTTSSRYGFHTMLKMTTCCCELSCDRDLHIYRSQPPTHGCNVSIHDFYSAMHEN